MFYDPMQIAERYPTIAKKKCGLSTPLLLARAFLAGMFIALAAVGAHNVTNLLPDPKVAKLIGAILFPAGLAMVLLIGAELFTGCCILVIGALKGTVSPGKVLRNWTLVYIGNFLGALLIGWLSVASRRSDPAFLAILVAAAEAKAVVPWGEAFLRGILCNILVCAAVWMSYATEDATGKIVASYFPVVLFVLCGTEHCVANMYYFTSGLFAGGSPLLTAQAIIWQNLVPVTLGNIVGGGVIFSGAVWIGLCSRAKA